MRMVGEKLKQGASTVAEGVSNVADSVKSTAQDASYRVREKVEDVKDAAYNFREEVKVRADAVAESGRRARVAPRRVGHELGKALRAWWGGLTTSIAMFALIGVVAITAWVVLTIALVVALNKLLFDPLGTFLVVVLYAIVAGVCYAIQKSRKAAAQAETRRRLDRSKEEVRYVGRPVREAFAGRGRAGF